jgi:hypothetical protein
MHFICNEILLPVWTVPRQKAILFSPTLCESFRQSLKGGCALNPTFQTIKYFVVSCLFCTKISAKVLQCVCYQSFFLMISFGTLSNLMLADFMPFCDTTQLNHNGAILRNITATLLKVTFVLI